MDILKLKSIIDERIRNKKSGSYTYELSTEGSNRIIQKFGEEAIETVIAALADDKQRLIEEASDLLFHFCVLLNNRNINIEEIYDELEKRHTSKH